MKKLRLLAALLTVLILAVPSAAMAVQYGGVGARPANPVAGNPRTKSIFIYQLNHGQQKTDAIRILNSTNQPQTIAVDAVDSVLSSDGAFSCAQAAEQKSDVGSWIKLGSTNVTLAPNTDKVVPFTVTVPANTDVGEHDGCVTIQAQSQTAKASTKNGVVLSFRSAIRVVVTIPGKIVKKLSLNSLTVTKASDGKYLVVPTAQNEGNVSLDADMHVMFNSVFGATVGKTGGGTYPVLPRTKASWNFELKSPFWGGWYHARATATYNSNPTAELGIDQGSSKTVNLDSALFFAPPSMVGGLIEFVILLVIAALVALYVKRQRNVRHIRDNWQDYTVKKDDDINSVAKEHHTSWKKLARVNNIKAPYHLSKDQVLKVPPKRKG